MVATQARSQVIGRVPRRIRLLRACSEVLGRRVGIAPRGIERRGTELDLKRNGTRKQSSLLRDTDADGTTPIKKLVLFALSRILLGKDKCGWIWRRCVPSKSGKLQQQSPSSAPFRAKQLDHCSTGDSYPTADTDLLSLMQQNIVALLAPFSTSLSPNLTSAMPSIKFVSSCTLSPPYISRL